MLLYECSRCKFRSPESVILCQTCGAKLAKLEPVKEVLYRLQDHHQLTLTDLLVNLLGFFATCISRTWDTLLFGFRPHASDFSVPREKHQAN